MIRTLAATMLAILPVTPLLAQDVAPYLDDRSTAERVVASLYNAIDRQEYLRAHSYFDPETAPDYDGFRQGYATTQSVRLRHGEPISDGAAGTLHHALPVAIEAVTDEGTTVYTGCYRLSQVQPAAQELPPFRPIAIDAGDLTETDAPFDTAMGTCDL
ncbi:hypothetical protein PANO111632_12695 [Paracoccus nototheniae]|uniref:Nuclear transport factor 2 family protein n=1 Tax=Paracoccus nototheniae TaxID=2489002 RepID=A0ABW4E0H9_9RHOB|nr:hypothetical protein [Paracoccus nototheniae]